MGLLWVSYTKPPSSLPTAMPDHIRVWWTMVCEQPESTIVYTPLGPYPITVCPSRTEERSQSPIDMEHMPLLHQQAVPIQVSRQPTLLPWSLCGALQRQHQGPPGPEERVQKKWAVILLHRPASSNPQCVCRKSDDLFISLQNLGIDTDIGNWSQLPCQPLLCSGATDLHNVLMSLNETVLCHLPVLFEASVFTFAQNFSENILEQPVFLDRDWSILSWIKCQMPSFVAMCTYPVEKSLGEQWTAMTTTGVLVICGGVLGFVWPATVLPYVQTVRKDVNQEYVSQTLCCWSKSRFVSAFLEPLSMLPEHQQSINEGVSYVLSKHSCTANLKRENGINTMSCSEP